VEVGNEISIVSINGAIVQKITGSNSEMTLEATNLENGVYFVNIQNKFNSIGTKKLVINK
jgi:hypothetical protein